MVVHKTLARIVYLQHQFVAVLNEADFQLIRVGVTRDIGQRFLHDTEQRRCQGVLADKIRCRHVAHGLDFASLGEFLDLPAHGLGQVEIIEDARPQFGRDAPNGDDRAVQHLAHGIQHAGLRLPALLETSVEPGQFQLESGQLLAQFVVQFAGNARALFFAHGLQRDRELTQLGVDSAKIGILAAAFGHVAQHGGELWLAIDHRLGDGGLQRKLATVCAEPEDVHLHPHPAGGHARVHE